MEGLYREKLSLLGNVRKVQRGDVTSTEFDLMMVELTTDLAMKDVPWSAALRVVLIGDRPVRSAFSTRFNDCHISESKLLHRKLGGLTSSKAVLCWKGPGDTRVKLRNGVYPKRPLVSSWK